MSEAELMRDQILARSFYIRTLRKASPARDRSLVGISGLIVVLLLFGALPRAYAHRYSMSEMETLGGNTSAGYAINTQGQVTGESATADGKIRAFLFTPDRGVADLGTLGGSSSIGCAINAHGQVTGWSVTRDGATHAFLYTPRTGMIDLSTLGGATSKGLALNVGGQVAGESATSNGAIHAFLYTPGTGMIDLGTLGGNTSVAYAINARGQVVGESVSSNDKMHAFLFADGTMRDLNSMVDRAIAVRMTLISGRGISNRGWILVNGVDATSDETRSYLLRK